MSRTPHTRFRVGAAGKAFVVQPLKPDGSYGAALLVDKTTGEVTIGAANAFGTVNFEQEPLEALAIFGILRLKSAAVLAVVTAARRVAVVRGHVAFEVTGVDLLAGDIKGEDYKYLELFEKATNPKVFGSGVYFSYGADLTLPTEKWAAAAAGSVPPSDARFWWNRWISQAVLDAGSAAEPFVVPFIQGFVGQTESVRLEAGTEAADGTLILIARRQVARAGTRHWRRGADVDGNVANHVESEQIVQLEGPRPVLASYVQVRGSIPVLWSEVPNIKYKPKREIIQGTTAASAFDRHVSDLTTRYGSVTAVNLSGLNPKKSEGKLSAEYKGQADGAKGAKFRLVPFDFHKQCGAKNYHRLDNLWKDIAPDVAQYSCFLQDSEGQVAKQTGVVRTNCIDCLDRTNVVQGYLGRKALESVLRSSGLLVEGKDIHEAFPELEKRFKVLWADHGDAVSQFYAGTGALKSGFTRTGKRTMDGFVDDGIKSVTRYYVNNFADGVKQDGVDLLTGAFDPLNPPPAVAAAAAKGKLWKYQPSPAGLLVLALALFVFGFLRARALDSELIAAVLAAGVRSDAARVAAVQVAAPVFGAVLLVAFVSSNGRAFVNRPRLRPDLVKPWM